MSRGKKLTWEVDKIYQTVRLEEAASGRKAKEEAHKYVEQVIETAMAAAERATQEDQLGEARPDKEDVRESPVN